MAWSCARVAIGDKRRLVPAHQIKLFISTVAPAHIQSSGLTSLLGSFIPDMMGSRGPRPSLQAGLDREVYAPRMSPQYS